MGHSKPKDPITNEREEMPRDFWNYDVNPITGYKTNMRVELCREKTKRDGKKYETETRKTLGTMTTKEVKLSNVLNTSLYSIAIFEERETTTPITELFLREFVSKKIKQIIDEPVKDRLRSIYNEVQSNNFVNEKSNGQQR